MNHLFYTLRDNLIRSYIYYIPDSLYENINKTAYKGLIKRSDLNKLAYFDNSINSSTDLSNLITIDFVTKSKHLEESVLLLFKAKEDLNDQEFQFVLNAYKEHVGAHAFITEQLNIYLTTYIKNVADNIANLFLLQAKNFDKHYKNVSEHFGKVEKPKTLAHQNILKKFKDRFSKPGKKIKLSMEFPPPNSIAGTKSKPKQEQKVLITNGEVDKFLLETVFNVDFNKVK